jgi:anthranilate phosphoribosyltransferase
MDFHEYIRAVGTGPKSNRELSKAEMIDCMNQILKQEAASEQIAAFLLGWRVRLESEKELISALGVFDDFMSRANIPNSIELGYPYDGKADNPYLFPLFGKYLKKFDLSIVVSGDFLQPAKHGITLKDIATNVTLDENIKYFDRSEYFKELSDLSKIRNILGLRTAFNTLEKLLNPANSNYAITSAFHKPYVEKYNKLFAPNYKHFVVVKGNEGTPEIFSKCRYWISENSKIKEYPIDPEYFGIHYKKSWDRITLEESLNFLENPSKDLENLAKLNVALLLVVAQKAKDINEGFEMLS